MQAARDLDCGEDEARCDERLRKVAGQKPVPEKPIGPWPTTVWERPFSDAGVGPESTDQKNPKSFTLSVSPGLSCASWTAAAAPVPSRSKLMTPVLVS